MTDLDNKLNAAISYEKLPAGFRDMVKQHYLPLALAIGKRHQEAGRPLVVGVNGAQGTGKSTLASFLKLLIEETAQLPCATFSIDDIYLTKAERLGLAEDISPLLATRGVPGTHDAELGSLTMKQLVSASGTDITPIPCFDKARDDRAPETEWSMFNGRAEIVIFEGWCVGCRAQEYGELLEPINELEENRDQYMHWRNYVNSQLEDVYHELFGMLDMLVMLKAPSLGSVFEWRCLQEEKLAQEALVSTSLEKLPGLMSKEQIREFIMHYERLTRWMLEEMPTRADYCFELDNGHRIVKVNELQ